MMDKLDIVLYGGIALAVCVGAFVAYKFFKKNKEETPKSEVMNKISDFYSTQDQGHNY